MPRLSSPDRWNRIERTFSEAVDLPVDRREEFLRNACAGDPDLLGEVRSLLAFDNSTEDYLEEALAADAATAITEDPRIGQQLGPWRIERQIGHGGMGAVYLAVRVNAEFEQHAAIKLIKRGMDTASVIERLRRERRIL